MKERVIVTGGSGFIGTNLVEYLIENGYDVLNLDFHEPKIKERRGIWKNVDLTDFQNTEKAIVEYAPDYIIHLAARTDLDGKAVDDYKCNTNGTKNVLMSAKEVKELKKIIVTSSMLVCRVGYHPTNQKDYNPSTVYGESKVEEENVTWENKPSCDWAIIRPTSIWGPWFGVPYRNFFDMVIRHHYFHIGNKSCTKTYGYVKNSIYQILQILKADTHDEDNKVFYVGDYIPTPIEDWANEIAGQLGYKIIKVPYWMIKCAAILGDGLKKIRITFPMTSFRLKNMTTDNIVNFDGTKKIAPNLPYQRTEGIKETLKWLSEVK